MLNSSPDNSLNKTDKKPMEPTLLESTPPCLDFDKNNGNHLPDGLENRSIVIKLKGDLATSNGGVQVSGSKSPLKNLHLAKIISFPDAKFDGGDFSRYVANQTINNAVDLNHHSIDGRSLRNQSSRYANTHRRPPTETALPSLPIRIHRRNPQGIIDSET